MEVKDDFFNAKEEQMRFGEGKVVPRGYVRKVRGCG